MARGWESKAVEEQIDAAESKRAHATAPRKTSEQLQREIEMETLEMDRRRVMHDLEKAKNPRYQTMLRSSLEFLEGKIAALRASG